LSTVPGAANGGLLGLVRAWEDQAAQQPGMGTPHDAVIQPPVAHEAERGADRAARRLLLEAAVREEELVAFADSLGRALVGELERHGIEVDAG